MVGAIIKFHCVLQSTRNLAIIPNIQSIMLKIEPYCPIVIVQAYLQIVSRYILLTAFPQPSFVDRQGGKKRLQVYFGLVKQVQDVHLLLALRWLNRCEVGGRALAGGRAALLKSFRGAKRAKTSLRTSDTERVLWGITITKQELNRLVIKQQRSYLVKKQFGSDKV